MTGPKQFEHRVAGHYAGDWTLVNNAHFLCPQCGVNHSVEFRLWESEDGAFDDYHYRCTVCGHEWWVDGADA